MTALVALEEIPLSKRPRCNQLITWGILAAVHSRGRILVSRTQLDRLNAIGVLDEGIVHKSQLFPSEIEIGLTDFTSVVNVPDAAGSYFGGQVLLQLLPYYDTASRSESESDSGFIQIIGTDKKVFSRDPAILHALRLQHARVESAQNARSGGFTRSAHYMGSKQSLAPFIGEIVRGRIPVNASILDLMCGSGAATGFFSRTWRTIASDVQRFSRLLALVQGGGFSVEKARQLIERVLPIAHDHFAELERIYAADVAFEDRALSSELDEAFERDYAAWVMNFRQLSGANVMSDPPGKEIALRRENPRLRPYMLFSSYYANLFFGVRQSLEIDSLRFAIDQVNDLEDRNWALGVLICAVSACADNYGGHFAQPRVKVENAKEILGKLHKTQLMRSLSVFQEFSARLLSLAEESETVRFPVTTLDGPWPSAIEEATHHFGRGELLVYLDPPYTREEYSRYYHVLETLVLYNYPIVSGRALVPEKGGQNRYSSEFFTRIPANAARNVSIILTKCLSSGWPVLWSYADSGLADMADIVEVVEANCRSVEIFSTDYFHTNQGRSGRRNVREFFVYLEPKC